MADKNVQIKDASGNLLYPKTKTANVVAGNGGNLGTVEPGAQVNVIEKITVNGVAVAPSSKTVALAMPVYSVVKQTTAESGYSATYQLTKDGTGVGEKINIPKDMVVQSGSVKTVTTANSPVAGYKVGDKYIDLVLANATNSHIYVLVSDLIDVYTAGTGVTITSNQISVNTSIIASKSYTDTELAKKADKATTLAGYGITDALTYEEIS
ncbi:MAG: hypothetical protein ACI4SV_00630 [Duodenibacillus sp.]